MNGRMISALSWLSRMKLLIMIWFWAMTMSMTITPTLYTKSVVQYMDHILHLVCIEGVICWHPIHVCCVWYQVTPPVAATSWRRPEALHCALRYSTDLQLHSRIRNEMLGFLSFFSTTMSHTSDFWLDYRGRLRCTYQTSAESVKIASKTDELWGARHAAMIALARYYVQVNGAAEHCWWRMRIEH